MAAVGASSHSWGPSASLVYHDVGDEPQRAVLQIYYSPLEVHGDGAQSRDFTYVDNVVDANLRAAAAPDVGGEVFNVGCGERVSLLGIVAHLERILGRALARHHTPRRAGDVAHTLADVSSPWSSTSSAGSNNNSVSSRNSNAGT